MATDKKEKKKGSELDELSLDELTERCKQIKELLASLENQYRAAEITEQSYKQAKEANLKKLNEARKRLEEWGIVDSDTPAQPAVSASKSSPPAAIPPAAPQPVPSMPAMPDAEPKNEPAQSPDSPAPAPSFAQKLKQQFLQRKDAPLFQQADDSASFAQMQSAISQGAQLELQKFQEKFNVELERLKATIDALKENRASSEERMQALTEGLAELRSNVFQREAGIKEQEMKLARLKESVDDIEPQKISKEFTKRDKTQSDMEIRVEKLEVKAGDLMKTIGEINALLKSIGGLENVASIDREAAKKLEKMQETGKSAERLSSKIEKMFADMNSRLEKFSIYEARQDNISEIVNDMIRNFDALSVKFESYAEKKEMNAFKEDLADMQKKMDGMKKVLKQAVPFAEAEVPEELKALIASKEDVEALLSSIEYEHEKKQIPDREYLSIREKNEARLKEIKEKIAEAMKKIVEESEAKQRLADEKAPSQKEGAQLKELKEEAAVSVAAEAPAIKAGESPKSAEEQKPKAENPKKGKKAAPAKKPGSAAQKEENPLLLELEESLAQGLINKETYENTKKLLMMG